MERKSCEVNNIAIFDYVDDDDVLAYKQVEVNSPFELGGYENEVNGLEPYIYIRYNCDKPSYRSIMFRMTFIASLMLRNKSWRADMLPLVGFLTISAIWVVAWAGLTSPLGASLGNESPREILSVLPLHVVTRRPMDEFSPRVRTRLGRYKPEDDVSNETQRFFTEERMGKRSIALGRSGFRPGKRSDSLESHGLRPGRGSFDEM
ncbi:hypothetical protein NECAME_08986 [Necator americanus]|uniref:Uncharacterized protein n=1 Tax=Necator americanus TaxID=51031 RepID=W2TFC8_NECAM|nr:hypothetical protein NECAME_08986 [Necator americanus]ETN80745.1 hypothetical protein NECAME_08986 [Necator americanus]